MVRILGSFAAKRLKMPSAASRKQCEDGGWRMEDGGLKGMENLPAHARGLREGARRDFRRQPEELPDGDSTAGRRLKANVSL
jgi:hypothetical protein